MKKYIIALFAAITLTLTLAGCQTEAQKVSQNLSTKELMEKATVESTSDDCIKIIIDILKE